MFYREIAPSTDLRDLILSLWEFKVPGDVSSPIEHEVFPDGCVSLYYYRNLERAIHVVGVSGLNTETVTRPVAAGDTFWGLRISPAACSGVLRADPAALQDIDVSDAGKFPHLLAGLTATLQTAKDLEAAVAIFEGIMRVQSVAIDTKVAEAVGIIDYLNGEIRIDELAAQLGLSARQFQRRFKRSSGLSPKQFARIRRIRATAVVLVENESVHWANRALEMGFSDQAHMAHEFKSVTNRSPNSFAKKVADIDHGDLVK